MLHGEEHVLVHTALPAEGRVRVAGVVTDVYDQGSGALVVNRNDMVDAKSGAALATVTRYLFLRGYGGFGGPRRQPDGLTDPPDRPADAEVELRLIPGQALLYRLSGDSNPLHSDPSFAARAGFDGPPLHGLCTYGYACRAIVAMLCDGDVSRFGVMSARFARPVMVGVDRIRVSVWRVGRGAAFSVQDAAGTTVLNRGWFAPKEAE
jgi:acyl dehydratase